MSSLTGELITACGVSTSIASSSRAGVDAAVACPRARFLGGIRSAMTGGKSDGDDAAVASPIGADSLASCTRWMGRKQFSRNGYDSSRKVRPYSLAGEIMPLPCCTCASAGQRPDALRARVPQSTFRLSHQHCTSCRAAQMIYGIFMVPNL